MGWSYNWKGNWKGCSENEHSENEDKGAMLKVFEKELEVLFRK